jgi:hypothetical protein
MHYKFNEVGHHKIPTAKYKVTNRPVHNVAPVRRGNLTVGSTEEAIAAWHVPGRRGICSDLAIETELVLRLVFPPGSHQIEGTLDPIAQLLGVTIRIPNHSTQAAMRMRP